jgi:hypothetical protein
VGGVEILELEASKGGDYVRLYHVPVYLVCARAHSTLYRVFQPPLQVLSYPQMSGVEDEPTVPVDHSFGELVAHLLSGLTADVAALRALGCIYCVGSPVADLLPVFLVRID